ncbi:MAG: alanyl-tRNA editing protein AlaXM [Candidatus Woesearchaeota archaeon]
MGLYLEDSYMKEFDATVKEVNLKFIILDRTAFYPQGGGQPCDTGTITSQEKQYNVIFVKKIEGKISHEVEQEGLKQGDLVKCKIDWEKRHTIMRYHTAAHILSTVINKETGAHITGNQLSLEKARIDFDLEKFNREELANYARMANEVIAKRLQVTIEVLQREEVFKIPAVVKLKKVLPESIKQIRVVSISGFDRQACAGTHVSNTSEIGEIEIIKAENKGASNRRLYFTLK